MLLSLRTWSFLLLSAAYAQATCYFPDHSVATNFTACNLASTNSHCCRPEEACLSNGYCFQQTSYANRITRGACTDQTFSSAACPSKCTDVAQSVSLSIYLAYDSDDGMFCCRTEYDPSSGNCTTTSDDSNAPFTMPSGLVIINREDGTTLPTNWTTSETSDGNTTTISVSTVTVSPTSKAQSITPIAAGIAVPLGVCLAAALAGCAVLWLQLRKLKRRLEATGPARYTGVASGEYDGGKSGAWSQASPMGASTPGYHPRDELLSHHIVEAPAMSYMAEAPTERQVAMADSRNLTK